MQSLKIKTLLLPICMMMISAPVYVDLACNVCQPNGAACVNLTTFHLCFGDDKPHIEQLFICNDGLECTDLPTICFQSTTRPASCGDTSSCGQCNANQVFACTSRSRFALCFGATTPSNVRGQCPQGKVCDASRQEICGTAADSIICDLDEST